MRSASMRCGFLVLLIITGLASCQCTKRVECVPGEWIAPCFSGFQPHELDTIIVKIYKPGTNFSVQTDSFLHDASKEIVRNFGPENCPAVDLMRGKGMTNDFEIILPGAGKTYRFADIIYEGTFVQQSKYRCADGPEPCLRKLASYRLDGELRQGHHGRCILVK